MRIPFYTLARAHARLQLAQAAQQVLHSGVFLKGPMVEEFQHTFARLHGCSHGVGVGSGQAALTLILRALQLPPGGLVLVPANTCFATVTSIVEAGLQPHFADPDPHTLLLSAETVAHAVDTVPLVAVVPVHLFGNACPMPAIVQAAGGLPVVEDCSQAHFAHLQGRMLGSYGVAAAFSLYPTKVLGALGDAGIVITNQEGLAQAVQQLADYGRSDTHTYALPGFNARMSELDAALLLEQLRLLPEYQSTALGRRPAHAHYQRLLAGLPQLRFPSLVAGAHSCHHLCVVAAQKRDELAAHLAQQGIGTGMHYPIACHQQPVLQGRHAHLQLPVAQAWAASTLSLPLFPHMQLAEVEEVCQAITQFYAHA